MSTATIKFVEEFIVELPPSNLPEEDGVPLESDWHRLEMTLLIELVGLYLQGRQDYFVGGNMFIYFDAKQARDRNFRGPDFFFVWNVPLNPPRGAWYVWDEGGKYPDVIIELSSPSTAAEDHGAKKQTYERVFHTSEYFIYDPGQEKLLGWRLESVRYQAIEPNEQGWLWSEQFGLWLGLWAGKYQGKQEIYLRFYDKDGNLIATAFERSEIERRRAEAEQKRADAEKVRADAAEAELRKLKAKKKKPKP